MKRTIALLLCLAAIACGCSKSPPTQLTADGGAKSLQEPEDTSAAPAIQQETSSPPETPAQEETSSPPATQALDKAPTGRIISPVNLVGTGEWNSIILHAKSSPEVQGGTYRWEIVTDSTHVDRGNLKQGGNPQNTMIESEANWVEFTAESLSTALDDVMVKVSYVAPSGEKLWEDSVTFTTADIRYLVFCPNAAYPRDGMDVTRVLPVDVYAVSSGSEDDLFLRLMVGLSSEISELNTLQVHLKLASIFEDGEPVPSAVYFNEIPDLQTLEAVSGGLPENPLPGARYFTSIQEIGAIVMFFAESSDIPPALYNTLISPSEPRRYIVCGYHCTLRPFLSLHTPPPGPICGGVVGGGIPWYGIALICVVIGGCLAVFVYLGFIRRKR